MVRLLVASVALVAAGLVHAESGIERWNHAVMDHDRECRAQKLVPFDACIQAFIDREPPADIDATRWNVAVMAHDHECRAQKAVSFNACIEGFIDREPPPPREVDPNSLEGRLTRAYGERCELAGYKPGTGAFGQCLLVYEQREQDLDEQRKALRAAMVLGVYQAQQRSVPLLPMQQPLQLPLLRSGAVCTTVIGNQLISRPCF